MSGRRDPDTLLDVLHLNVEFGAKCLSCLQIGLVLHQEPHIEPHTSIVQARI